MLRKKLTPGVPQGHDEVPPESRQDGLAKSLANQKSTAREMAALKLALFTNDGSAPPRPPCQAAAIVAKMGKPQSGDYLRLQYYAY